MQRKEEELKMKKFLSVFLTAALAVSMLAGCGSKNETVTAKVIDIDLTDEEYAEIASRILDEWLSESDGS